MVLKYYSGESESYIYEEYLSTSLKVSDITLKWIDGYLLKYQSISKSPDPSMYVDSVYLYIDDKINELKHVFCKVTSYYSYQIKEAE